VASEGRTGAEEMNKYRNKPTVVDGIRFASKREAYRYKILRLLEKTGDISHLAMQPRYDLRVNGLKICTYVADFVYIDRHDNVDVVEDCKGMRTPIYKLKAKLMKACLGITIRET
jgi:hypothetical protein